MAQRRHMRHRCIFGDSYDDGWIAAADFRPTAGFLPILYETDCIAQLRRLGTAAAR